MNWLQPQVLEIRDTPDGIQMLGLDQLMKNTHYLSSGDIVAIVLILAVVIFLLAVTKVVTRSNEADERKAEADAQREHELILKYGRPTERCETCGRAYDEHPKLYAPEPEAGAL